MSLLLQRELLLMALILIAVLFVFALLALTRSRSSRR
jgi:hypothetical protein